MSRIAAVELKHVKVKPYRFPRVCWTGVLPSKEVQVYPAEAWRQEEDSNS